MVIHFDVLNIYQSEVQFVLEVWGEGWIITNFIDMAFSVVRFPCQSYLRVGNL